jgi:hypothetical protein
MQLVPDMQITDKAQDLRCSSKGSIDTYLALTLRCNIEASDVTGEWNVKGPQGFQAIPTMARDGQSQGASHITSSTSPRAVDGSDCAQIQLRSSSGHVSLQPRSWKMSIEQKMRLQAGG